MSLFGLVWFGFVLISSVRFGCVALLRIGLMPFMIPVAMVNVIPESAMLWAIDAYLIDTLILGWRTIAAVGFKWLVATLFLKVILCLKM